MGLDGRQEPAASPSPWLLYFDLALFALLSLLCFAIGGLITRWYFPESYWDLWLQFGMFAFAISIPTTFLMHSSWTREYPAAAPLLAVMWRSGSYFMLLFLVDATKWPSQNLVHNALLGYYFPFLVLESSLFIRKVSRSK